MGLVSSACDPMTNPPPAFPVAWCCFDHVQSPDKSTQHMIANAHSLKQQYNASIMIAVSALWAQWASESEIISEASARCAYSFGGLSDLISKNPDRRNSSVLIPPKTWSGSVSLYRTPHVPPHRPHPVDPLRRTWSLICFSKNVDPKRIRSIICGQCGSRVNSRQTDIYRY